MQAEIRKGQYRRRNISNGPKENSVILVDIDGALSPYADEKFRHVYRCECGHEFTTARLGKADPVSCPRCGRISFKRNEPSLGECLSIIRKIISKNVSPYQRAQSCLRRLAVKYPIFYVTGRDQIFSKESEAWLISNHFPYSSPHRIFMRKSDNAENPCRLKARLVERLSKRVKPVAIIDDDLSLIAVAKSIKVPFIWAPACWERNSYYGQLLAQL